MCSESTELHTGVPPGVVVAGVHALVEFAEGGRGTGGVADSFADLEVQLTYCHLLVVCLGAVHEHRGVPGRFARSQDVPHYRELHFGLYASRSRGDMATVEGWDVEGVV